MSTASAWTARVDAFREGLRDLGYVEGSNIAIEFRFAQGQYDRLPELAAELVRLKVDVIVTHSVPGTLAAKRATQAGIETWIGSGTAADTVARILRNAPNAGTCFRARSRN